MIIEFKVYGLPAPQGSKTAIRNKASKVVGSRESSKAVAPWRQELAGKAREYVAEHGCLDGPLVLDVVFRFPMGSSARKADRERGWAPKSTMPDYDKLARAVGDSLKSAGLIKDDARIVDARIRKVDVWESWTGAEIRVGPLVDLGAFRETARQLVLDGTWAAE